MLALASQFVSEDAGRRHIQQAIAAARRPILVEQDEINNNIESQRRDRKAGAWQLYDRDQQ